jgi:hypothetical protein
VPAVPQLSITVSLIPAISVALAKTNSWFLPPRPLPFIVTVVSPHEMIQAGFEIGFPDA